MTQARIFGFWFVAQFVLYGLLVANGRAYVQANYPATLMTDMIIAAFNFWFAKRFIEGKDNRTRWALAGCVLGGGAGSLVSIYLTKLVYGQ